MRSWKTTFFGLLAAAGGAILGAYELKPALLAAFPPWLPGLGWMASAIGTACMGLAARDNSVTSEQAGAGQPSPGFVPLLLALFLASGILAGLALVNGCGSTPPQISYRTAATTCTTVDAAMTAWGHYVAQFHPPANQESQVKAAFEKYQAALLLVLDANQLYIALAGTSPNAPPADLATRITATQTAASQAYADLLALLTQYGVKL